MRVMPEPKPGLQQLQDVVGMLMVSESLMFLIVRTSPAFTSKRVLPLTIEPVVFMTNNPPAVGWSLSITAI